MFVVSGLTLFAQKLENSSVPWLTNSVVMSAGVVVVLVLFAQIAVRQRRMIPSGLQNFAEFVIESLHSFIEGIVGGHMIKKVFPLLATFFLFILVANWSALLPGVGTIGWGHAAEAGKGPLGLASLHEVEVPLFRPPNADLNMTAAMMLIFFAVWVVLVLKEQGLVGFLKHTFVPRGVKGFLFWLLIPIFLFVGCIEMVSIALRGVSLPVRLFGNNFAGENLLHAMGHVTHTPWVNAVILVPFYFLELLIGAVQALVFTLLCAVYIKQNTEHGDEAH